MENPIFQIVANCQYSSEAVIYKGKLESEGIEIFMRDNLTIDSDPMISNAIGGVKLYVRSEDFEKAKDILSEISRFSVDNDGKPIQCPNCGSEKSDLVTSVKDSKSLLSFIITTLIGIFPLHPKYSYKCSECNAEFQHQ